MPKELTLQETPDWLLIKKRQEAEEKSRASFATCLTTLVLTIAGTVTTLKTEGDMDLIARTTAHLSLAATAVYFINAVNLDGEVDRIQRELTIRRMERRVKGPNT